MPDLWRYIFTLIVPLHYNTKEILLLALSPLLSDFFFLPAVKVLLSNIIVPQRLEGGPSFRLFETNGLQGIKILHIIAFQALLGKFRFLFLGNSACSFFAPICFQVCLCEQMIEETFLTLIKHYPRSESFPID